MNTLYILLLLVAALSLRVAVNRMKNNKITKMDTTGWTTHCFGRFLIDLPPNARVHPIYKVWGKEVTRLRESPQSFTASINAREQELKAQQHRTEGSMFIRREPLENGSVLLYSWSLPYSKVMLRGEAYLAAQDSKEFFKHGGDVSPGREDIASRHASFLSQNIDSRSPNDIPSDPGFCIDHGFIAGNTYRAESARVGITLPDHPGLHMSFWSSTGASGSKLLERAKGFLQSAVAGAVPGMDTLRKRTRDVGPIQAEEYLIAASGQGQRVYGFKWESQGKDGSLFEPNLSFELNVLDRSADADGNPPPPAFESDKEALALWDTIIESIRLRIEHRNEHGDHDGE